MENVSFGSIWYKIADFGIQFELELKYLEIYATTIAGNDPEVRAKLMDQVQRHIDPQVKSQFDQLLDKYKKTFKQGSSTTMSIRTEGRKKDGRKPRS